MVVSRGVVHARVGQIASGFMRLRNITGKSRILRKPKAAKTGYGCNINTRNIGRLMSIYPYPRTSNYVDIHARTSNYR